MVHDNLHMTYGEHLVDVLLDLQLPDYQQFLNVFLLVKPAQESIQERQVGIH